MSAIVDIHGREILDSRGNPTVEVEAVLESGATGRAAVPSGASTGTHEAVERRDGGDRYGGKGGLEGGAHINGEIFGAVAGLEGLDQRGLDAALIDLDGTPNKSRLGANALLGVSLAVAHAAAEEVGLPLYRYVGGAGAHLLPVPMMNVINGGAHADNNVDLQEFIIVPIGAASFAEAVQWSAETYHQLKALLHQRGLSTAVGDEGGFAPDLPSNEEAVKVLVEAIETSGRAPGTDIAIAIDAAASEFYRDGRYHLASEDRSMRSEEFSEYLAGLCDRYPIISVEDGMAEDDWDGWAIHSARLGRQVQLVGDDIFVTSQERLARGVASG